MAGSVSTDMIAVFTRGPSYPLGSLEEKKRLVGPLKEVPLLVVPASGRGGKPQTEDAGSVSIQRPGRFHGIAGTAMLFVGLTKAPTESSRPLMGPLRSSGSARGDEASTVKAGLEQQSGELQRPLSGEDGGHSNPRSSNTGSGCSLASCVSMF